MNDEISLKQRINQLKREKNAVVMAHYYTLPEIQEVADYIGDSLALAQKAATTEADIIVLCGVHFMGETAKIINPGKKVIVPDDKAGCSLADSCPAEEFEKFISENPGHTVISYVNTSAAVKALTDIVVTSGNALKVVESLPKEEKIIFGPDRNLGSYINSLTGRNMKLWDGACHVHERFSLEKIIELKKVHPGAELLVHPECTEPLRIVADKVGSTAVLLKHAIESNATEFIVATESGILFKMQEACPNKKFIPAPPNDSTCACNECAFMKLATLEKLLQCMEKEEPSIEIEESVREKALRPIEKMLNLSK